MKNDNTASQPNSPDHSSFGYRISSQIVFFAFLLSILFAGITLSSTAEARRDHVAGAVDKAVYEGKSTKKVKGDGGHEFNVKPPKVRLLQNGRWEVKGELSHHLRLRHDDEYYYRLELNTDGELVTYRENIRRGGVGIIRSPIPIHVIVETFSRSKLTTKKISDIASYPNREIGKWLDGKWEGSARKIALRIGAEVAIHRKLEARAEVPQQNETVPSQRGKPSSETAPARRGTLTAPSRLILGEVLRTSLTLVWMDNTNFEHGVSVERGTPTSERGGTNYHWKHVFNVEERVESRIEGTGLRSDGDDDLTPNTEYCYRLRAYRNDVFSDYSVLVCTQTQP